MPAHRKQQAELDRLTADKAKLQEEKEKLLMEVARYGAGAGMISKRKTAFCAVVFCPPPPNHAILFSLQA